MKLTKESAKIIIIFLILLQVISPIIMVWHLELSTEFKENIYFTNGFFTSDPIQIYHLQLYVVMSTSLMTAILVFYNLDKLVEKLE